MSKPLILVTNDDGITAPGIRSLINAAKKLGEVVVVAPDSAQSGMGHAITIKIPLKFQTIVKENSYQEYAVNGTPVDCVKIAFHRILNRKPDLVVSGINHGSNSSINIIYSGTMAAALEGSMGGVPAIGFSLHDYTWNANFDEAEKYSEKIMKAVLENSLPKGTGLNVNFPKIENGSLYQGIKVARQGNGYWKEDFEERLDPRTAKPYYWLKGEFFNYEIDDESTDEWAIANNFVSVVPVHFDFTNHNAINDISKWFNNKD